MRSEIGRGRRRLRDDRRHRQGADSARGDSTVRLTTGQLSTGQLSTGQRSAAAGLRVLRLDSTNMADVQRTAAGLRQDELPGLTASVKPDRSALDLLFEVLLNCGLAPSAAIAVERIDGREIFVIDDGALIACFARDISL